jgi:hypothetical protein
VIGGFVLVGVGVGLLITAPAFSRDSGEANQRLLGDRRGGGLTSVNIGLGVVLAVAAIVAGIVWIVVDVA